nr:MAG TPA: hypothetical protein [Caudoviricetes sp.]
MNCSLADSPKINGSSYSSHRKIYATSRKKSRTYSMNY